MTKISFEDAYDNFRADMTSSVIKHAKTVDFEPFIKLLKASIPIASALLGVDSKLLEQEFGTVDADVICRTLDNIDNKMFTINKDDRSDADNTTPSLQGAAPAETASTTPETADYGQETAPGGTRHAPAAGKFTGADGDETTGEENDGGPGLS